MANTNNDATYRALLVAAMKIVTAQREVLDKMAGPNAHVDAEIASIERRQGELDTALALRDVW